MIFPTEKGLEGNPEKLNKYSCACAIFASVIPLISGYDTGVMSGAMLFMQEDLLISDVKLSVLAAILNLFAILGSLLVGRTSDIIGRRYTISLACAMFSIGSILMGYSPNYGVLLAGRCVAGFGVGFAMVISPVYSAEISSPGSRGLLIVPQLCISIGILLGYISNLAFEGLPLLLGWRLRLGIAAIPITALALGSLAMPESPRWLVMHGRLPEAHRVLSKVCNTKDEAIRRLRDIKLAAGIPEEHSNDVDVNVAAEKKGGKEVWKDLILRPTPAVRWILVVALGIHFFAHATGIEAVLLYSPMIFKKAGVTSKVNLLRTTVGVGLTKIIFILVATFYLDKIGRRMLLLTSTGGVIVALSMVGFCLTIVANSKDQLLWAMGLCMASVYLFIAFFSIGLGPVTWVYSSEIFPLRLRAQGMSLGVAVNRLMNATISVSFISIYEAITIGGVFFLFAGISVVAWFFFYFFLPETKGRTLEEMELLFSRSKKGINGSGNGTENGDIEIQPRNNIVK